MRRSVITFCYCLLFIGSFALSAEPNHLHPGNNPLHSGNSPESPSNNNAQAAETTRQNTSWPWLLGLSTLLASALGCCLSRYSQCKRLHQQTQNLSKAKQRIQTLEQHLQHRDQQLTDAIQERQTIEKRLFHLAFHDILTGLPNRSWLLDRLNHYFQQSTREPIGILFLDGDRFKRINDTYGHMVGDELLNAASKRLKRVLIEDQTAIRLGGDEFVVLAENHVSVGALRLLSQAIIEAFETPFSIRNVKFDFQVSIGAVVCGHDYQQADDCLRDADIAMYQAKQKGRGQMQFFDLAMREQQIASTQLESSLRSATDRGEIHINYQPQLSCHSRELISFDTSICWNHPTLGRLPAEAFIPTAETSGQIYALGLWYFEQVCQQLAAWQQHTPSDKLPIISLPVSPVQINMGGIATDFKMRAQQQGIPPHHIHLCIDEAVIEEHPDTTTKAILELSSNGFGIAINGFGISSRSLVRVNQLPIHAVRLNPQLMASLNDPLIEEDDIFNVLKAISTLCRNLGIIVIAQAVNDLKQWQKVMRLQCSLAQGDHLAPAMSSSEANTYLLKSFPPTD